MSRIITFSRTFPSHHPKAGQPTYFLEKIYDSLASNVYGFKIPDQAKEYCHKYYSCDLPKHHTIRAGHRWKVGDRFSPRIWSGKPYASKQIIIAPDIVIKKIWDIQVDGDLCIWIFSDKERGPSVLNSLAKNDGLTKQDLQDWFNKPFTGQIICWNRSIDY